MQDLRLVGIHEDGEHVLLADSSGERYRVALDDALRQAIRRERPKTEAERAEDDATPMSPKEVQGLIRAGVSLEDVAERSGWTPEKVRRYEPPIRAERDYVAGLARAVQVRGRSADGGVPTLATRAATRLDERGVEAERVEWDSWKTETGAWTVVCIFPAGGRERRATWRFDPRDRTLSAVDDEARWLGEDEQVQGPIPSPAVPAAGRNARVYDVEAEGGILAQGRHPAGKARGRTTSGRPTATKKAAAAPSPPEDVADADDESKAPLDLMSAMRERSASRKKKPRPRTPSPTDTPISVEDMPEDARPIERLHVADGPPPMGSHPGPDELAEPGDDDDLLDHDPVTGTADLFADLDGTEGESDADSDSAEGFADDDADDEDDALDDSDDEVDEDDDHEPGNEATLDDEDDELEEEIDEPQEAPRGASVPVPGRQSASRRGRPSVPSWDDIMFGRRPSAEH